MVIRPGVFLISWIESFFFVWRPFFGQKWPFFLNLQISQNLFSNFFSNLAYELLMAIPVCMPNAILVESLEVGHLGPNLAQIGFPMLNSPMLYNGDILLLIPH